MNKRNEIISFFFRFVIVFKLNVYESYHVAESKMVTQIVMIKFLFKKAKKNTIKMTFQP